MADDQTDQSNIQVTEQAAPETTLSGRPDGTVEKTDTSISEAVRERIDYAEKIVHEVAGDAVVGWHKIAAEVEGKTEEVKDTVEPVVEDIKETN